MRKRWWNAQFSKSIVAILPLLLVTGATAAQAAQESPTPIVSNAITMTLSPSGQRYFTDHFRDILAANGFELDQGQIPSWKYLAADPIDLNNLPLNMNGVKTTLGHLRDMITRTLLGIHLNNPKLDITVNGIEYSAKITHLGLRVDPNATSQLADNDQANSIVVDLEVEIPNLSISIDKIGIIDENNTDLGEMGVNSLKIETLPGRKKPKSSNLKFRVPLEVSADPSTGLTIKALAVQTNLPLVAVNWSYARPLRLPYVEVTINGRTNELSYTELENQIDAQKKNLAKALASYLKNYLDESGAGLINGTFQEAGLGSIPRQVTSMNPIGCPTATGNGCPSVILGLIPSSLKIDPQGNLQAGIDTYVQDPSSPNAALSEAGEPTEADLSSYSSPYDLAISVDEQAINQLLQLSYDRGYFNGMQVNGQTFSLVAAPAFQADPALPPNEVKLHISMAETYQATGLWAQFESFLAIENPVRVNFDIIERITVDSAKGELSLIDDHIDMNSVQVNPDSLKFEAFKDQVLAAVKSNLAAVNSSWAATVTPLAPPFEIPQGAFGIPLKIQAVQADRSGRFNIFAELSQ